MNAPLATAVAGYDVGRANPGFGAQFEELFDGVDDLIRRVADVENPEIRKIRARVHATMVAAKEIAANGVAADGVAVMGIAAHGALDGVRANQVRPQAVQVADAADDYSRSSAGRALSL